MTARGAAALRLTGASLDRTAGLRIATTSPNIMLCSALESSATTVADEQHIASETWRVSPDMMCILDQEGRFVAINPAWQPTLGWAAEEIIGSPYVTFLHPDDLERSMAAFAVVKSGQPVLRFENRYRRKDGGHRWFSWVAVPEGEHFYCTIRDITDDKERDQTIVDQHVEGQLREQFLAILGHDLRNPLTSFIAGVRLLSNEPQSEQSGKILAYLHGNCIRMSELVANMMDFARVRLGDGIGLQRQPIADLEARMKSVIEELERGFPESQIAFTADFPAFIECDAPRILQVLSNLVGNAITHGAENELIKVRARVEEGRFNLAVSNSGDPIPHESRETLFQPFFKGNSDSSLQGLGLGLYICSQIAEAHGGTLRAESAAGKTTFEFEIPV